ncbi:hypothetical protein NM688_g3175 [Phlebia brevispora]|uniref:Uncharacterized protein n=1 Tax=Phlebia brevispora TaxID=194682 RepID=A0ACC1T6P3_9APHY|nr:hypothetical protein NM688_g3175 [Phlebia brevispora]
MSDPVGNHTILEDTWRFRRAVKPVASENSANVNVKAGNCCNSLEIQKNDPCMAWSRQELEDHRDLVDGAGEYTIGLQIDHKKSHAMWKKGVLCMTVSASNCNADGTDRRLLKKAYGPRLLPAAIQQSRKWLCKNAYCERITSLRYR